MNNPQWRVFYHYGTQDFVVECDTPQLIVFLENDRGLVTTIERR